MITNDYFFNEVTLVGSCTTPSVGNFLEESTMREKLANKYSRADVAAWTCARVGQFLGEIGVDDDDSDSVRFFCQHWMMNINELFGMNMFNIMSTGLRRMPPQRLLQMQMQMQMQMRILLPLHAEKMMMKTI